MDNILKLKNELIYILTHMEIKNNKMLFKKLGYHGFFIIYNSIIYNSNTIHYDILKL